MSVTSILADCALTTYATAKGELQAIAPGATWSDDSLQTAVERIINVSSEAISTYCGRLLHYGESIEKSVPPRGTSLRVTRTPLDTDETPTAALDGVSVGTLEIQDAALGLLYCAAGFGFSEDTQYILSADDMRPTTGHTSEPGIGSRDLAVTYTGGWITPVQAAATIPPGTRTLPWVIEEACILTVAYLWRLRNSGYVEFPDKNTVSGIIPDAAISLLRPYRVVE